MQNYPVFSSARMVHKRAKELNLGLSYARILELVKSGAIPTLKNGNQELVKWDDFLDFVNGGYKAA